MEIRIVAGEPYGIVGNLLGFRTNSLPRSLMLCGLECAAAASARTDLQEQRRIVQFLKRDFLEDHRLAEPHRDVFMLRHAHDELPASPAPDKPALLQHPYALSHGGAVDAEFLHQFGFGSDFMSGLEAACNDFLLDRFQRPSRKLTKPLSFRSGAQAVVRGVP